MIQTESRQQAVAKLLAAALAIGCREAIMLFVTHDLNPRALSPKVKGFVQAQSWFQDLTPIEVAN